MIRALFHRITHSTPPAPSLPSSSAKGAGAGVDAPAYSQLLADRAHAQARYDAASAQPRSIAARDAQRRLWAATCAVLDHEARQ